MGATKPDVLDLRGREDRWLAVRIPKGLLVLRRNELITCLAQDGELFEKMVRRGKQAIRERERMRRAGMPMEREDGT